MYFFPKFAKIAKGYVYLLSGIDLTIFLLVYILMETMIIFLNFKN